MSIETAIASLQHRFLRPRRDEAARLAQLARDAQTVADFLAALPSAGVWWPRGNRWFRLPDGAEGRRFFPDDAPAEHVGHPASRRPADLDDAVLFACDAAAMEDAEYAARTFVELMWPLLGREGLPPTEVVWRVTDAASRPGGPLAPWLTTPVPPDLVVEAERRDPRWSPWFRLVVRWTRALQQAGFPHLSVWVALWRTGAGLWAVHQDHIELFLPERADAPVLTTGEAAPTDEPRPSAIVPIPEAMVDPARGGDADTLEVLADWLAERDDPRAAPVRLAVAVRRGRASRAAYHSALSEAHDAMLRPFSDASAVGGGFLEDAATGIAVDDGMVTVLTVPPHYTHELAALLDHPGAQLLRTLYLRSEPQRLVRWPERCTVPELHWTIGGGSARPVVGDERWCGLRRLTVRSPPGSEVTVEHRSLQTLRLEQPRAGDVPVCPPRLDTPSLRCLEWVTSSALGERGPAIRWLRRLVADPPRKLRALELRPASLAQVRALRGSKLWGRLRWLGLSSVRREVVPWLEEVAPELGHLDELVLGTVNHRVRQEIEAWSERHAASLPRVRVRIVGVRRPGDFGQP